MGESETLFLDQVPLDQELKRPAACIVLLHPPGPQLGRRINLVRNTYLFGRDGDADFSIDRGSISRRHAELVSDGDGGWKLRDLGSTNGTFVNERRVTAQSLNDGDHIRLGDVIFKFLSGTHIEAAYHEEIYQMTITDALTRVANRRYLLDFLGRELASAGRHRYRVTVAVAAVDDLDRIRESFGGLARDAVLKQLAARLAPRIRRDDLFARYSDERFAVLLRMTELDGAVKFAEDARRIASTHPFSFNSEKFHLTLSVGIATILNEASVDGMALLERAEKALHEAQRRGGDQVMPQP